MYIKLIESILKREKSPKFKTTTLSHCLLLLFTEVIKTFELRFRL